MSCERPRRNGDGKRRRQKQLGKRQERRRGDG
jgi:hypothetical protein